MKTEVEDVEMRRDFFLFNPEILNIFILFCSVSNYHMKLVFCFTTFSIMIRSDIK